MILITTVNTFYSLLRESLFLNMFLTCETFFLTLFSSHIFIQKFVFCILQKKIKEGLAIDDLDKAANGYLESIKKDIGTKKFDEIMLEKGDATLMFTIDTTGSMGDEIAAAKAIVQYIINIKRKFPVDFILSPFNDPGIFQFELFHSCYIIQ